MKFFNEQHARHNGRLHWPGFNGLPIRYPGDLVLKNEDYQKLVLVSDFHFKLFDISNEEDREYYQWVNDRIYAGLFTLIYKDRFWDKEKDILKIYMEWCQHYFELPGKLIDDGAAINNVNTQDITLVPTACPFVGSIT
jgi:hypothetical protein